MYGYAVASNNMSGGGALGADGYVTFAGGYGGALSVESDISGGTY